MASRTARARSVTSSEEAVLPDSAGSPKFNTDRRTYGAFARSVDRFEPRGVEQPGEIAQHRLPHAALRQDARLARLLLLVRFVVGETIQQRRLQPILGQELLSHDRRRDSVVSSTLPVSEIVRTSMSGTSSASVARMR